MLMSARTFLLLSLFSFVLMLFGYAWLVDARALPARAVPFFYPQFLLESSAPIKGKVIVESGSNSAHAIDPWQLAEYFNAPALVLANRAGFPLEPKIFNLEKYVGEGDVVILPLEWNQYVYPETYPSDFVSRLFDPQESFRYFFNNLPAWEKYRLIYTKLPLVDALAAVRTNFWGTQNLANDIRRLNALAAKLESGERRAFGGGLKPGPMEMSIGMRLNWGRLKKCDEYIFAQQQIHGYEISDTFRRNLSLLKLLSDKGASVYFTWPAVVDHPDSRCYEGEVFPRESLEAYAREIESLVESEGFQFIGSFDDSRFPADCLLDTYYHLTQRCALIRTGGLVKKLREQGVAPINSDYTPKDLLQLARDNLDVERTAVRRARALARREQ
jgi:hypothetical protein